MPGGQGLRFSPRDDLLRERTDQAGDVADRLIGDVSRAERRDKMTGCQIEVFLTYPAAPVCLPHGRTGIRVGGAKRRGGSGVTSPAGRSTALAPPRATC